MSRLASLGTGVSAAFADTALAALAGAAFADTALGGAELLDTDQPAVTLGGATVCAAFADTVLEEA